MPETSYLVAAVAVAGVITVALRAVPFAALAPLRRSRLMGRLAVWMPPGLLLVLAASTLRSTVQEHVSARGLLFALAGVAVTVVAHLLGGRRTLLSVCLGTVTYVVLANAF